MIRDNYTDYADGIVDIANESGFTAYNTTNYYMDHIHLNDTGYAAVAAFAATKIALVL
jgi:lysophospholipase L1-like esterase